MPTISSSTPPRRNLELKARLTPDALADVRERCRRLGVPIEHQRQVDRYFTAPEGRLKLRTIAYDTEPTRAELIAYRRPNVDGSRWSSYRILTVDPTDAEQLSETLAHVAPILVEVRKRRDIAVWRATRIHLDVVDGLGAFAELETVIDKQPADHAEREHREVVEWLGLAAWPAEAESYCDLLLRADRRKRDTDR